MRLTTALRCLAFIGAGFLAAPLALAQDDSIRFQLAPASFSVPATWAFERTWTGPTANVDTAYWAIREKKATPTDVLMFAIITDVDELPALEAQFDAVVQSASLR